MLLLVTASSPLYMTTMMAQVPSLLILDGKKVKQMHYFLNFYYVHFSFYSYQIAIAMIEKLSNVPLMKNGENIIHK